MFSDLNKCRQSTQYGYQTLAVRDIVLIFDLYEVQNAEQRKLYFDFITALDSAWLKYTSEQLAARNKVKSKKG